MLSIPRFRLTVLLVFPTMIHLSLVLPFIHLILLVSCTQLKFEVSCITSRVVPRDLILLTSLNNQILNSAA